MDKACSISTFAIDSLNYRYIHVIYVATDTTLLKRMLYQVPTQREFKTRAYQQHTVPIYTINDTMKVGHAFHKILSSFWTGLYCIWNIFLEI